MREGLAVLPAARAASDRPRPGGLSGEHMADDPPARPRRSWSEASKSGIGSECARKSADRVERAKALLTKDELSMAEVALAAGFAHQSHMARHMRRMLGLPPRALKRLLGSASAAR